MRPTSQCASVIGLLIALSLACGSSPTSQGGEGQHCYPNGTCNTGLSCLSNLCVMPGGTGGTGGMTTGTGGSGGSGGGIAGAAGTAGTGGGVAGATGTAGTGGGGGTPTEAGLHISWSLVGATSGATITCAAAGAQNIDVLSTRSGTTTGPDDQFPCTGSSGVVDALHYPFGSYSVNVSALTSGSLQAGSANTFQVTLAASPCDRVVSGNCMRDQTVVIRIDNM